MKTGIITKEGMVKISDTKYVRLPVDATAVGGKGWFQRQSIKPFIGMKVEYDEYDNFKIIKE